MKFKSSAKGILIVASMIVLFGCEKESAPQTSLLEDELKSEIVTLTEENEKLKQKISIIDKERQEQLLTPSLGEIELLERDVPELKNFTSSQVWTAVTIVTEDERITIDNSELMENLSFSFLIDEPTSHLPNGPMADIDTFMLELTNETGTYQMNVVQSNLVEFPEWLPDTYFQLRDTNAVYLGKAFQQKPSYVPIESMESRMLNSGAIQIEENDYEYWMVSSFRVRSMAIAFILSDKLEVMKPEELLQRQVAITFYWYGSKIQLTIYPSHAHIIDGEHELWYEIDEMTSSGYQSILHAG